MGTIKNIINCIKNIFHKRRLQTSEYKQVREQIESRNNEIIRKGYNRGVFFSYKQYIDFYYECGKDIMKNTTFSTEIPSKERVKQMVEAYNKVLDIMEEKIDNYKGQTK
jgi:hypothetical protein